MSEVAEVPELSGKAPELGFDGKPSSPFEGMSVRELQSLEMLVRIRNERVRFAKDFHLNTRSEKMNFADYPHIKDLYNSTAREIVLQGCVQSMKAASVNSVVHTPMGWKRMGDLKVGDRVSTPEGGIANVCKIQPRGVQKLYKFYLDDGREVETSRDHLWKVLREKQRTTFSSGRNSLQWNVLNFEVLNTQEIMSCMKDGTQRFTIPVPNAVEKPETYQPLDPYFVGLMLGDGEIRNPNIRFSNTDKQLIDYVRGYVSEFGLTLGRDGNTANYFFKRLDASKAGGPKVLRDLFETLGLLDTYSQTKFIPRIYKNGSIEQRFAVLQGLLDTDGCADTNGGISITLSSETLIKDIQEIVWSLGGMAKYVKRQSHYYEYGAKLEAGECFILTISMPQPKECFRLPRKKERVSENHRRTRTLGAKIVKVEYSRDDEVQCIALDSTSKLYIMDNYVVTHNSEWVIVEHFASAFCGLSIFFVLPKFETRNQYVQNRINKTVQGVDAYKKIMGDGFFDNVALKNFGRGTIRYVGSNVLTDFKEFPADMVIVDEVDECDPDNVGYALDRLRGSYHQFKRYLGNPKIKGSGINALYQKSDQRAWHVPCKSCKRLHETDWFKVVVQEVKDKEGNVVSYNLRDLTWEPGCRRDIKMICPDCGGELERASQQGKWIPKNPDSPIEGYHISMLCSPINSISGMWERFLKAQHDPLRLQQFYNSDLGLPYAAAGNQVTQGLLDKNAEPDYNFKIDADCAYIPEDSHPGPCSMGVDVGGVFDVRVSAVESRGRRRMLYVGKVKHVDELHAIIERYNVEVCVIDSMPEITLVQDFQETANCAVWLCSYRTEGKDRRKNYNFSDKVINIDRTECLDRSFSELKRGKNVLPANYMSILAGKYVAEMCGPVREIIQDEKGRTRYEWKKCEDHQRHADSYDQLAKQLMMEGMMDDVCIV